MLHSWYNKGIWFSGNWLNIYQLALSRFTYLKIINYSFQTYWNKYGYKVSIKLFILLGCTGSMSSRPYVYSSAAQHFPSVWEASWMYSLQCYRNITIVSKEGQIATHHSANFWAFPSQNNFFLKALEIKTSAHLLQFPRDWLVSKYEDHSGSTLSWFVGRELMTGEFYWSFTGNEGSL